MVGPLRNLPIGVRFRKRPMKRVDAITKRDFPLMSRVLYDFEQLFGPTERICVIEAGKQYGEPSPDAGYVQIVLEKK